MVFWEGDFCDTLDVRKSKKQIPSFSSQVLFNIFLTFNCYISNIDIASYADGNRL